MAPDSYSKLPLSGSSGFTNEPQELPLHTSMTSSVPLPLATAEHGQPGLRSQYNYTSTSTPQISGSTVTMGSESAFTMPRYMDGNARPCKSPRHQSHQSIHSNGSIQHAEGGPDYRYGSFRGMSSGVGDVSPGGNPPAGRDYYPSANTWTTTAAEPGSNPSYASHDGRSYPGVPPLKQETPSYNSTARGSFDSVNNYSWSSG